MLKVVVEELERKYLIYLGHCRRSYFQHILKQQSSNIQFDKDVALVGCFSFGLTAYQNSTDLNLKKRLDLVTVLPTWKILGKVNKSHSPLGKKIHKGCPGYLISVPVLLSGIVC